MHSSDIAFKPNEDGWGGTRGYSQGWDNIFKKAAPAEAATTASVPLPTDAAYATRLGLLQSALDGGALSQTLFAQVRLQTTRERMQLVHRTHSAP